MSPSAKPTSPIPKSRHHTAKRRTEDYLRSAVIGFASLLTLINGVSAGEVLYNGIELPANWPPRRTAAEMRTGEIMRVPYLDVPPAVIPIDVGRQLFVDDFLIEKTTLTRRFHKLELFTNNPVLRPDKRWEKYQAPPASAMAFSDGCFYDPIDRMFKIWYRPSAGSGVCFATSSNGLIWTKPALDVRPTSNITLLSGHRDSSTVWLDHDATDPQTRFKLFQFQRDLWRASVHTSPDGIHWTAGSWTGPTGDRSTMFFNPFRKVWVFSIRSEANGGPWEYRTKPYNQIHRARRYWETKDFIAGSRWQGGVRMHEDWKEGEPAFWVAADQLDSVGVAPGEMVAELYNLDATPYESLMLGLFCILHDNATPSRPKLNDIMLGFSRDGFHWARPFREPVISTSPDPKAWNAGNVQSVGGGCLIVGDRLYFYASGRNATEDTTGLAFLRRDGFASMDAGATTGWLTTRPVRFSGRHLFVNLDAAHGELRAEVLDADNNPIPPFTMDASVPISTNRTLQQMTWRGSADLSQLAGRTVKFRFHLGSGSLYSFWVSPNTSGASQGFVAAGGPGFNGPTDTIGDATENRSERIQPAKPTQ